MEAVQSVGGHWNTQETNNEPIISGCACTRGYSRSGAYMASNVSDLGVRLTVIQETRHNARKQETKTETVRNISEQLVTELGSSTERNQKRQINPYRTYLFPSTMESGKRGNGKQR